jgi:hypothetical protein
LIVPPIDRRSKLGDRTSRNITRFLIHSLGKPPPKALAGAQRQWHGNAAITAPGMNQMPPLQDQTLAWRTALNSTDVIETHLFKGPSLDTTFGF